MRIQGFNFRGVDAVNAVSPALRKHGVVVTPDVRSIERATVGGRSPQPDSNGHVTVVVAYTFTAPRWSRSSPRGG